MIHLLIRLSNKYMSRSTPIGDLVSSSSLSSESKQSSTFAAVNEMVQQFSKLEISHGGKSRRSAPVRKTRYLMDPPGIPIYSYSCLDHFYKKENSPFPTMARGLFVRNLDEPLIVSTKSNEASAARSSVDDGNSSNLDKKVDKGNWEIVIRGYDKFFNVNEVKTTSWSWLESNTVGPYEVTTKENGCIIFMSAVNGHLLVTSKHATGSSREANTKSHAKVGEYWMELHLAQARKTRAELASFFEQHHVTAVFELGDDEFEEHILEYPPQRRGLFLHGINANTPEFHTWSYSQLKPFAQEFGFLLVTALTMDNIREVKDFTDNLRASGAYDGRAVEGFVVRSHLKLDHAKAHFFKVKYDEPYLMFREWREGTKSILKDKGNRFIPKYELSRRYFAWVQRKRQAEPGFFAGYLNNKGIIAARNAFLSECGLPGVGAGIVAATADTTPEFKRGENTYNGNDESVGADKTLLLPIATIGAGKTTLGQIMSELYGIGHIQNDNITVQKNGPAVFESEVIKKFDSHNIVYADRNNHLRQHRKGISEAFKNRYPAGRIVALSWKIEPGSANEIAKAAIARIEARGENHQSLTPHKTDNYKSVIYRFTKSRDPLDIEHPADYMIDEVVDLNFDDNPKVHLDKICNVMGWEPPPDQVYQRALNTAFKTLVTIDKAASFKKKEKPQEKKQTPRYYGIRLDNFDVKVVLNALFKEQSPDRAAFWRHLVEQNRVKSPLHVTLAMTKLGAPNVFDEHHSRVGSHVANLISQHVQVAFSGVVWDNRAMALRVEKIPVDCVNVHPHATVGTRDETVKPVVSNQVLSDAYQPDGKRKSSSKVNIVDFKKTLVVDGVVAEFFS